MRVGIRLLGKRDTLPPSCIHGGQTEVAEWLCGPLVRNWKQPHLALQNPAGHNQDQLLHAQLLLKPKVTLTFKLINKSRIIANCKLFAMSSD